MKWMKWCVILGVLCFGLVGCDGSSGGSAGDQNDPSASGDDDAQMNEDMGAEESAAEEEAAE